MTSCVVSENSIVVLLPHHDDEFFLGLHLPELLKAGHGVFLIYLTYDPRFGRIRASETKRYLADFDNKNIKILELGADRGVLDGALYANLQSIFSNLMNIILWQKCLKIIVPAWEGGHHDHDAAHFIGATLCKQFSPHIKLFEFGLYSGEKLYGPFFRLSGFKRRVNSDEFEPGSYLQRLAHAFSVRHFKTQWNTFVGLWPFIFLHRIIGAGVVLREVTNGRNYNLPPHLGELFYQRRFKVNWPDVSAGLKSLE
jgi:LmbE family N-acetylglucosaminyl deacetylase